MGRINRKKWALGIIYNFQRWWGRWNVPATLNYANKVQCEWMGKICLNWPSVYRRHHQIVFDYKEIFHSPDEICTLFFHSYYIHLTIWQIGHLLSATINDRGGSAKNSSIVSLSCSLKNFSKSSKLSFFSFHFINHSHYISRRRAPRWSRGCCIFCAVIHTKSLWSH